MTRPALPFTAELAQRLAGSPLVLLLDIDGTLSPIAPRPDMAVVPLETRRTLAALARLADVRVAVITGRGAADAARVVAVDGLWIVGNHGFEIAAPGANPEPRADALPFADRVARAAERLEKIVTRYPGAVVENKRWTLTVHFRLVDRKDLAELVAASEHVAHDVGLRAMRGKEVVELRPPVAVDKGTAAVALAHELGGLGPRASLLCAGDDVTDEDAFVALRRERPECVTVCVLDAARGGASARTAAEFSVTDTEALRELLRSVLEMRREAILAR